MSVQQDMDGPVVSLLIELNNDLSSNSAIYRETLLYIPL